MDEPRKLHPVMWVAAVSVTVLSAVGVAAITGVLPHAGGQNAEPAKLAAVAPVPQPVPVAVPPAAPATFAPVPAAAPPQLAPTTATPEATPTPAKMVKHKKPVHVAQANSAYAPPPYDAAVPPPGTPYPPPAAPVHKACPNCATVESVRAIQQKGQGSGLGIIAGGLVGGLLGNQVGAGHGRDAATVVGALAGGYAGNEVEKSKRSTSHYEVIVRFEDGTSQVFKQESAPPWQAGDRVKVVNGEVVPR